MSGDLGYLGLAEVAELIRDKKLSPVEYTTALLARIPRSRVQRLHRVDAGASTGCGAGSRG
jgi:Asp-tRNA(Asn)/Glu-tRNA(Gln) amidotransferase A subunit family amidase